jgi:hypothetical protein
MPALVLAPAPITTITLLAVAKDSANVFTRSDDAHSSLGKIFAIFSDSFFLLISHN